MDCSDPGTPSNGRRTLNGTTFRSSVTYTCNDDYRMKGESRRRCLSSGHWSGSLPLCVPVDCGEPRSPQNGYTAHRGTVVGNMVSYSCNRGYNLIGNLKRTCLNTGLWSGSVPECRSECDRHVQVCVYSTYVQVSVQYICTYVRVCVQYRCTGLGVNYECTSTCTVCTHMYV